MKTKKSVEYKLPKKIKPCGTNNQTMCSFTHTASEKLWGKLL